MIPDDLLRGDLIKVTWADINEDPVGDPDKGALCRRTSFGLFWSRREDDGIPVLVTTTTLDKDIDGQNGFCIYPEACIRALRIVKKVRRPKRVKVVETA